MGDGPELFDDQPHKLKLQADNGLLQFSEVVRLVQISRGQLRLTRRKVLRFHRFAIQNIYRCAGRFRTYPVKIRGAIHRPPDARYVRGLVGAMCERANQETDWSACKTAAYLLWRLNWIHPFGGGNGRTSRALGYYALCVRLGFLPRGKVSIAEQIDNNRGRYQNALREADMAWSEEVLDVSLMESLVEELLIQQIKSQDA